MVMHVRVALVALLVVATTRDAEALMAFIPLGVAPKDGAVHVPTNAVLFAPPGAGDRRSELSLEDEHGVPVPVVLDRGRWDENVGIRPREDLQPDQTYSIVVRWKGHDWEERRTFHTGMGPDTVAPPALELGDPSVTITEYETVFACDPGFHVDVHLEITTATRAPSYLVTADGGEPTILLPGEWDAFGQKYFHDGDEACMTVQPRDLAGNLGPSRRVCMPINPSTGHRRRNRLVALVLSVITAASALALSRRRRRHILL